MPRMKKAILPVLDTITGVVANTEFDVGDSTPTWIGSCTTAANVKDKVATVDSGFVLEKGQRIGIKFSYTNTFSSSTSNPVTLNVNNTGAKNIYYNATHSGAGNTSSNNSVYGFANRYIFYVYDGIYWVWNGSSVDNNTTYTPQSLGFGYGVCATAYITTAKTVAIAGCNLIKNGIVSVTFNNGLPSNATLNVNSKGAKPIYHRGAAIKNNVVLSGDTATFIYDGTNYNLIAIDRTPSVSNNSVVF